MVHITITLKYTLNTVKDSPLSTVCFFTFQKGLTSIGKKPTLRDTPAYVEIASNQNRSSGQPLRFYSEPFISPDLTTKERSSLYVLAEGYTPPLCLHVCRSNEEKQTHF